MSYLAFAIRLSLALVCLVAVVGKVSSRRRAREFVRFVERMGVDRQWAAPVATGVVVAEGIVAGLLLWPATAPAGSLAAAGLFLALAVGVWRVIRRGRAAPRCFCFGRLGLPLGRMHVIRNATLAGAAAVAAVLTPWGGALERPAMAVSAVAAVLAAMLVVAWEDMAALFTDGRVIARSATVEVRS